MNTINRSVLITGANDGIGLACVNQFLDNGFNVIGIYHNNHNNLSKFESDKLRLFPVELSDPASVKELILKIKDINIDVLINNAAIYQSFDTIDSISTEDLLNSIQVNTISPFLLSQSLVPIMIKNNWGRVVNVSSIGVKFGGSESTIPYTVSKNALESLTPIFSKMGAKNNVLVNTVRPGVTNTKIHSNNKTKDLSERVKLIPQKRIADPLEIAGLIYFLCSEQNTYVTGQTIAISGGE